MKSTAALGLLLLLLLLVACSVTAQPTTFCDRYTEAIFGVGQSQVLSNETALITAVVDRALHGNGVNGSVAGLFALTDNPVVDVFSGTVKYRPNAPNYVSNTTLAAHLESKLVVFFGNALGCTAPGFPAVTAGLDMAKVHANMQIGPDDMAYFINQVSLAAASFGVTTTDINTILVPFLVSFNACGQQPVCEDVACDLAAGASDSCVIAHFSALVQAEVATALAAASSSSASASLSTQDLLKMFGFTLLAIVIGSLVAMGIYAGVSCCCRPGKGYGGL